MRLLGAEILKLRRRLATYVVLAVLLVIMGLVYILVGISQSDGFDPASTQLMRFPDAYATIGQFVFGLGSLLAVAYAAAIAGADWNWGVLRNVVSRGESRVLYILAKAAGLAVIFAIGVVIAFAVGIVLVYLVGMMRGQGVGDPIAPRALRQLVESLLLGYPVLLERAAIGFAVAILLKSQLAGVIVGIVLYIGEGILGGIMVAIAFAGRLATGLGLDPIGPEWYQYLPFTIGNSVMRAATPAGSVEGGFQDLLLRPVPVAEALLGVLIYLLLAIGVSSLVLQRAEINA